MIIIFGPAGAGKSLQGQLLSARHGWRWLSSGQLLRDSRDSQVLRQMQEGGLVDNETVNRLTLQALKQADSIDKIVLDGFPRALDQAKWLVESQPEHARSVQAVVVLDIPDDEVQKRLALRGRPDDTREAIAERLAIYHTQIDELLEYFGSEHIAIKHVDAVGSVGQVHDRVEAALVEQGLVEAQ